MMQQAPPRTLPIGSGKAGNYSWMPAQGVVDLRTRIRIAAHVKAKMEQLGIETPAELGRRLRMHRSTVGRMLTGGLPRLGLDLFIRIHRVLGIDATLMLDEDPPKRKGSNPSPNGQESSPVRP